MTIKNLAFFGVMASIFAVANANADVSPATRIATVGYVDGKIVDNAQGTLTNSQTTAPSERTVQAALQAITAGATAGETALQPGDNVSELVNDAGYVTAATAPIRTVKQNGTALTVTDGAVDVTVPTVPTNVSAFTNDSGYITAANAPIRTVKQNGTALTVTDGAVDVTVPTVPTNVSAFTNDAGYITNAAVPTNVSELTNDSGYVTAATAPIRTVKQNGTALTVTDGAVDVTVPTVDQTYGANSQNAQSGVAIASVLGSVPANSTVMDEIASASGTATTALQGVATTTGSGEAITAVTEDANHDLQATKSLLTYDGAMNSQLPHFDSPSTQNIAWASGNCTRGAPCVLTFDGSDYVWTTMEIPSAQ